MNLDESVRNELSEAAKKNLDNVGRGIGNIVESHLINPLARFLFDNDIYDNSSVQITDIKVDGTFFKTRHF